MRHLKDAEKWAKVSQNKKDKEKCRLDTKVTHLL